MRNIAVTLECFVKKDGKYLMLHRSPTKRIMPDVWMAPGGHREFNEGLFACAKREVCEETGLEITNIQIRAVGNSFVKDLDQEFFFHILVAEWTGGELVPKTADGEFVWLTPEDILKLPNLLAELPSVLPHVFSDNGKILSFVSEYEAGNQMNWCRVDLSE